jgi:RNA polymerase sigma-70 factor, ECF subfamily
MELYRRYGPALLRKCERILGNRDDAEDVVQTLFVELLKKRIEETSLPYLYRAATNRCLNIIRDKKKRNQLLERYDLSLRPPPRTALDARVVDVDLLTRLVAALDKASSEILVFRYLDDMTQEEVAEITGLSRKTIGKKLKKIAMVADRLHAEEGART